MKKILKLVFIALLIALVAGGVYLAANPAQASALWGRVVGRFPALAEVETFSDLWDMLDAKTMRRSEKQETTPARALTPAYAFPLTEEELELGIEWGRMDMERVYTYFQDIGGDLWLPYQLDRNAPPIRGGLLCGPAGVVRQLDAEACAGDPLLGQLRVSAAALGDLPEGDYWLAARVQPPEQGAWYELYYLSVHAQCAFHTVDVGLATGANGGGDILFDRAGGGFTFHLFNLGDNRVVDVWQLTEIHGMNLAAGLEEEPTRNFSRKRLKPGDFTVSPDGASVTLRQDYLNGLRTLYPYYFLFGLADHAMVDSSALGEAGVALNLTDGPLADPPYVDGPKTYSLSSGADYYFTLHMGQALSFYVSEDASGLWFGREEGFEDSLGHILYPTDLQYADETCPVPALVLQEAAARGNTCFNVQVCFQLSDTYYQTELYRVEMVP